jgi:hypothetical protein
MTVIDHAPVLTTGAVEVVDLAQARLRADGEAVIAACREIVAVYPEIRIVSSTPRQQRARRRLRAAVGTLERLVGKP